MKLLFLSFWLNHPLVYASDRYQNDNFIEVEEITNKQESNTRGIKYNAPSLIIIYIYILFLLSLSLANSHIPCLIPYLDIATSGFVFQVVLRANLGLGLNVQLLGFNLLVTTARLVVLVVKGANFAGCCPFQFLGFNLQQWGTSLTGGVLLIKWYLR